MSNKDMNFGEFLREKRQEREITLRKFAEMAGISPVYMSTLETNQRHAPKDEILERMVRLLLLSKEEEELFYDLAVKSAFSPRVSGDLPEYIINHEIVKIALRTAKDADATDDEWQEFIEKLRKRKDLERRGADDGI